ncbi:MAG: Stealth CR1 domain-containing protein [Bacteroides sp.]|nr:Stealth CR1 domain-containing protein [Bacteroides sp.]
MNIDLVYLWVDGNDPKWRAKHDAFIGQMGIGSPENCKGRYNDNDELKYSLRSIESYAPWIHKIFIITDNQVPEWLDTSNPKIRIVDHSEILPPQSLPCFNSNIIEHFLSRIPDLSEHFLYSNDDTFLNRPVSPSTFYTPEGLPIIRLHRRRFRRLFLYYRTHILKKNLEHYIQAIKNSADIVHKKYGRYFNSKPHHNIDAFLKSDYMDTSNIFKEDISSTLSNHFRSTNDVQRIIYTYAALAKKRVKLQYVSQKTSFRFPIHKHELYQEIEKYNPTFFCMNDSQFASDSDRIRAAEYLQHRFPVKSQFEK